MKEKVVFEREKPFESLQNDLFTRRLLMRIDALLATHLPPVSFLVHPVISVILASELDVMLFYLFYFGYTGLTTESFRKSSVLNQTVWVSVCLLPIFPLVVLFCLLVLPSIVFWYMVYFKLYVKAPEIWYQVNPKNISLIKRCPSLLRR